MEKLLKPEEVAQMLNIQLSTVYNWTYAGKRGYQKIPFIKVGSLLRFRQSDIEKWLNEPKVKETIKRSASGQEREKTGYMKKKNGYIDNLVEQVKKEVLA